MDKFYEYNQELFMIFIDYKQEYDFINREKVWIATEKLGLPAKITKIIRT